MIKDHIKEETKNLAGTKQIIWHFRANDDIDVIDENNIVHKNKTYYSFLQGTILTEEEENELNKKGIKVRTKKTKPKQFGQKAPINADAKTLLAYHREQTFRDVMENLKLYGRCALIRPCAFGKTIMAYRIFERFDKCLYIYPSGDPFSMFNLMEKINNADGKKHSINVDCHNYNWLWSLSNDEIRSLDYDFIFFDEMHKLGGHETSIAAQKIILAHQNHCCFVGATATPNRMDGRDVLGTIFHNHTTYKYDLEDALKDGIIQKPHYFYTGFNVREYITEVGKTINHGKLSEEQLNKILGHSALRQLELDELPNQIRRITDKTQPNKTYLKFIVFCQTIKISKKKKSSLVNSSVEELADEDIGIGAILKNAYPNYNVNVYKFHSQVENKADDELTDSDEKKLLNDTQAIRNLPVQDKTIDIILSCDRLCQGYHDENVSGIIMYRTTRSQLKFTQMIGRAFSCIGECSINVFDIADNLHIKPEFNFEKKIEVSFDEVEKETPTFEELRKTRKSRIKTNIKFGKPQRKEKSKKPTENESNTGDVETYEDNTNNTLDDADSLQSLEEVNSELNLEEELEKEIEEVESMPKQKYDNWIDAALEKSNELRKSIINEPISFDEVKPIPDKKKAQIPQGSSITKEYKNGNKITVFAPSKTIKTPKNTKYEKITINKVSKSRYEGVNAIQCESWGHQNSMLDRSSVITENEEADIDSLIKRISEEPEERLLEAAYKAYVEVEDIKPITSTKDLLDGSENAEFQTLVIKIYAEEYNIKEQDFIDYILKKAS